MEARAASGLRFLIRRLRGRTQVLRTSEMSRRTYCVRLRPVRPFREMRFVLAAFLQCLCGMAAVLLAVGASA
jgi:hypothetical protein